MNRQDAAALRGTVIWIMGVPASGKSTLARGLQADLRGAGAPVVWLDSDALRAERVPEAGYGDADRAAVYGLIGQLAGEGVADGQVVVISATAARQEWRDAVANQVGRIIRIWLTCDPKALRGARDIKGLYAASDAGEITRLPGQGLPFEAPEAPDLTFDTTARSADDVLRAAVAGLAALARGEGVGV